LPHFNAQDETGVYVQDGGLQLPRTAVCDASFHSTSDGGARQ